ncbi:MAG: sel1 repeat family protein [Alphaproteobacteria bacterium]|nr:sel1 repeat family protein [Alphaproteobacteria bacterium]
MKRFGLFLFIVFTAHLAFATTWEEDYKELEPHADMLTIQTSAVLNLLEPYIQKGNAAAAYIAAAIHEQGKLVEKNEEKAFELYLKAAEKNPYAQMKVASMYTFGHGTDISFDDAMAYYEKVLRCDNANLRKEAAERIILLDDIIKKEEIIKEKQQLALSGDPTAMLEIVNICLSIDNYVCAYIWLTLSKKHPAFAQSEDDLQNMIDRLSGEMTMSQIMKAEDELGKISQAAKK